MLKLIIVDDEKIIRETIQSIIDWESLGIEVVDVCSNGIDAYDSIIDKFPDIVLTDIKMPGLTGLELIAKVKALDNDVEFIILSSYGEFSFATEAMQYGVQNYLLKPCNEEKIIEAVSQAALKCRAKQKDVHPSLLEKHLIKNILLDSLTNYDKYSESLATYTPYINFDETPYHMYFIYFLELQCIETYLERLYSTFSKEQINQNAVLLYVTNTMIIFFKEDCIDENLLQEHISTEKDTTYQHHTFPCLNDLLTNLLPKIRRFDTINCIEENAVFPIYNYNQILRRTFTVIQHLDTQSKHEYEHALDELMDILLNTSNLQFLISIISSILTKLNANGYLQNIATTTEFLIKLQAFHEINEAHEYISNNLGKIFEYNIVQPTTEKKDFIETIITYVNNNLEQPNLSLKWIAENILFMNADYVSKQFINHTGSNFSSYLNRLRIERAKSLIIENNGDKLYSIAEKVGCGNNPQYFSQWFKKNTGISPSKYLSDITKR